MQIIARCISCKHFINDKKFTCKAFPKGIPNKFIYNEKKHDHKVDGQTGDFVYDRTILFL